MHPMRRFESRRRTSCLILGLIAVFATAGFVDFFARRGHADDWPTYRHDQRRSGMSSEQLKTRRLELAWHFGMSQAPSPAWPDAARWDAYAGLEGLRSMRNYDPVLHPVIVGQRLYLPGIPMTRFVAWISKLATSSGDSLPTVRFELPPPFLANVSISGVMTEVSMRSTRRPENSDGVKLRDSRLISFSTTDA